jgi:hypothetical protein
MRGRILVALAVVTVAGCGNILGLDGYTDAVDAAPGDAQPDAQPDAPPAGDGGGCGNFSVCAPELPSGWAWAMYAADQRAPCANGYGSPTDVEEGLSAAAASCGCNCTTTDPSCATGNLTITAGANNTCDDNTNQTDVADAGCNALGSFSTSGGDQVSVTGPSPTGGGCSAVLSQTIPPVGYDHQGRTCAYAGTPGSGCSAGSVCVPNPAPFAVCVEKAGVETCPSGFPNQHLVGTTVDDTRACGACTCTYDAGDCTGNATVYSNFGCTGASSTIPVTGTCTNVGNHTWRTYQYNPTTSASCEASAITSDGGVAFNDPATICCK